MNTDTLAQAAAISQLRDPDTIRWRARAIQTAGHEEKLPHFRVHPLKLPSVVDYVADTVRDRYPNLNVPFHSRWRHFDVGGVDRWAALAACLPAGDHRERGRVQTELAITSVLLDAGAGTAWCYRDSADGRTYSRSEGLALASLALYRDGLLSADDAAPHRADGRALSALSEKVLAPCFQVSAANPMVGLTGRVSLLQRLGQSVLARPDVFGADTPRLGALFDWLTGCGEVREIEARQILAAVLELFADVWPDGYRLAGQNLGDVGYHSSLASQPALPGLMPFHKLSQWLTYSLIEPLQSSGINVMGLDALTGLPEYRNGGLLVDLGLLQPRDPSAGDRTHPVDSEFVVEWRALTVAFLDDIASGLRSTLARSAEELPLASVLEGGTWAAGRRCALARRADGAPPFRIESTGTIF